MTAASCLPEHNRSLCAGMKHRLCHWTTPLYTPSPRFESKQQRRRRLCQLPRRKHTPNPGRSLRWWLSCVATIRLEVVVGGKTGQASGSRAPSPRLPTKTISGPLNPPASPRLGNASEAQGAARIVPPRPNVPAPPSPPHPLPPPLPPSSPTKASMVFPPGLPTKGSSPAIAPTGPCPLSPPPPLLPPTPPSLPLASLLSDKAVRPQLAPLHLLPIPTPLPLLPHCGYPGLNEEPASPAQEVPEPPCPAATATSATPTPPRMLPVRPGLWCQCLPYQALTTAVKPLSRWPPSPPVSRPNSRRPACRACPHHLARWDLSRSCRRGGSAEAQASVTKLGRAVYLRKPVLLPNGLQMVAHLVPGSRQRQLDRAQMTSKAEMLSYL
ncbi:uncharacterized protein LOC144373808 isoform X2 [Ictidomys tridecemlineatus]